MATTHFAQNTVEFLFRFWNGNSSSIESLVCYIDSPDRDLRKFDLNYMIEYAVDQSLVRPIPVQVDDPTVIRFVNPPLVNTLTGMTWETYSQYLEVDDNGNATVMFRGFNPNITINEFSRLFRLDLYYIVTAIPSKGDILIRLEPLSDPASLINTVDNSFYLRSAPPSEIDGRPVSVNRIINRYIAVYGTPQYRCCKIKVVPGLRLSGNIKGMFADLPYLTDISELAKLDTSKVFAMDQLLMKTDVSSIEPLKDWNIDGVVSIRYAFAETKVKTDEVKTVWERLVTRDVDTRYATNDYNK